MQLWISLTVMASICGLTLGKSQPAANGHYSPEQQQRIFSQMINDLRHAYADRLSDTNKRLVELEKNTNVRVAELESTLKSVLSGKSANVREARLLEVPSHTPHVAFYALLTNDVTGVGNNQAIVFDQVETNVGSAYNKADGIFTAPVSGTYSLSWTTFNEVHSHMQTEIMVNNVIKGRTWSDAMDHEDSAIASNTAVLQLNAGDVVWIRANSVHSRVIYGRLMSTFSGWLLFTN